MSTSLFHNAQSEDELVMAAFQFRRQLFFDAHRARQPAGGVLSASERTISVPDSQFLEDVSRRSFRYFWELTDPDTGMTRGRCRADGTPYEANRRDIGSIAVTGFGLAGLCIAAERGWVRHDDAQKRARNALRFFADHAPQEHGWFFHWMNVKTGERTGIFQNSEKKSEISSIDTALLVAGILTVRSYFRNDKEIRRLATLIYGKDRFQVDAGRSPAVVVSWLDSRGRLSEDSVELLQRVHDHLFAWNRIFHLCHPT
jgi:hypothetical protein